MLSLFMMKWFLANKIALLLSLSYVALQIISLSTDNVLVYVGYFISYMALLGHFGLGLLRGKRDLKQRVLFVGIINIFLFIICLADLLRSSKGSPQVNQNDFYILVYHTLVPILLFVLGTIILFFSNLGYSLFTSSK